MRKTGKGGTVDKRKRSMTVRTYWARVARDAKRENKQHVKKKNVMKVDLTHSSDCGHGPILTGESLKRQTPKEKRGAYYHKDSKSPHLSKGHQPFTGQPGELNRVAAKT